MFSGLVCCQVIPVSNLLCLEVNAGSVESSLGAFLSAHEVREFAELLIEKARQMEERDERDNLQAVLARRLKIASLHELRLARAALDGESLD